MPFASAKDGVQLHYQVHDYTDPWRHAPTLILQHGFGRSSRFWFNLVPYLARFYRVVCPDLRGLGASAKGEDFERGISVERYLGDLLSIADRVAAESFHYAGESLGGVLGMALAAGQPQRVRTLTLMSAPLTPGINKGFAFGYASWQEALRELGPKGWAMEMNSLTRFPAGTDPGLTQWYGEEMGNSDLDVLLAMSRFAPTVDVTPCLERIQAPVLGFYAAEGVFVKSGQEATLRARVAQLRLVHFPGPNTMVWMSAPAACAGHLLHFMAAHDGLPCRER